MLKCAMFKAFTLYHSVPILELAFLILSFPNGEHLGHQLGLHIHLDYIPSRIPLYISCCFD